MHYIYLIVNKVNGNTYVGQHKSNNWQDKYMGSGHYLACAKKKYGLENFEKFLIQYCNSKEEADKAEIFWIAEYRKCGKAEYNLADGGSTCAGYKHTEDAKKKMSEAKKGKVSPRKGTKLSDETKKKLSDSHKNKTPWNKVVPCSEYSKQVTSLLRKGSHWKLVDGKRVWY